jgi:hypothetical protein
VKISFFEASLQQQSTKMSERRRKQQRRIKKRKLLPTRQFKLPIEANVRRSQGCHLAFLNQFSRNKVILPFLGYFSILKKILSF